jgi:hypothetical protein
MKERKEGRKMKEGDKGKEGQEWHKERQMKRNDAEEMK